MTLERIGDAYSCATTGSFARSRGGHESAGLEYLWLWGSAGRIGYKETEVQLRNLLVVAVGILFVSVSVFAQESLTLDAAEKSALEGNRELAAARVRVEEAKARLQQAGLWPNPELEMGGRFDRTFYNGGEYGLAVTISQPISVGGRIAAQKDVARVDIERTSADIAELERHVIGDVRRVFTEIFAADEEIRLQKSLIGLNEELLTAIRAALERAQVSEKDVNAILIARQQAQQKQVVLETQRRGRLLELNTLIGKPADYEFVAAGKLELQPLPELSAFTLDKALERRPDFIAKQLDVVAAKTEQRLARAERLADWRIGAGYEQDRSVVDGAPPQQVDQFVGLKLAIPLPLFDRKQGRIRETQALEDRAGKAVAALRIQIAQELAESLNGVKTLAPLLESYQGGLLKRAEDNVKLVEDGYRQGLTNIVEVIQSRQQFAELQSSYIDTLKEYQEALFDLEIAAGMFPCTIQLDKPTEVNKP